MSKNHIITALDIGSSSIKSITIAPKPESSELEVLSQVTVPCFGVRKGAVINAEKVSEIISQVLSMAQKECGQKINDVYVNINGSHIFSTSSHGAIAVSRADQKISQEDIERVIQAAQTFSLSPNREILEVFPKEFIVDGEKGIRHALGMEGVRLETEIIVLGCFSPYLKNLEKAVLESGYEIADIGCGPLANAQAVLTPRQKELGVLLLDIGAGTTGVCAFSEGTLVYLSVIPIGSGHITSDIAIGLKTDIDTAEIIKLQYGSCFLGGGKKIKIKEKESGENLSFSQKMLGKIIDARISELFEQIKKELKKTNLSKMPAGVVLCGGGAKLPKLKDLAKKDLGLPVRIGKPIGFFPVQEDPQLACVCGLALGGREYLEEEKSFTNNFFEKIKKILRNFIP